jgi:hypothetical protein
VLTAAEQAEPWFPAYVTLSLLAGARTEELRALTWSHVVAYDKARQEWRPVIEVGREHDGGRATSVVGSGGDHTSRSGRC